MLHLLVLFSLVVSSAHAGFQDFCVADLATTQGPAGYPCKPSGKVTTDDFVYSGMEAPAKHSSLFNNSVKTAFVYQFPGLNGRGLSVMHNDLVPGGVVPMHSHPAGSEAILVAKGSVTAGFISSDNIAYMKTLKEGDIMVFPQGLMHFQVNTGHTLALVLAFFSTPNPGWQGLSEALFSSNLPSEIIERITFIDLNEVRRLKALFGGSG